MIIEERKEMKNKENFIIIVLMIILAFIFLLKSPLHPWIGAETGIDSSVFKTVAIMMEKGYMPYKDSFDHKGPLLYILNWIGDRISRYRGIWVIEYIFITGTFFMLYKISRLKCGISSSVIVTMVSISLLFQYYKEGNYTEEYAMLFIAMAIYIFLDYLFNQRITKIRLLICGFGLGATLLLRANMVSVWVVFSFLIFGQMVINRKWNILKHLVFWFVSGMCIAIIPILIWLAVNNSLLDFWESYIVFNKVYISAEGGRASFTAKWNSYISFFNTAVFIVSFSIAAYMCKIKDKVINTAYVIYMLITLLLVCLSGMTYGHYGMVLVPMFAYPIALLFGEIEKIEFSQIAQTISIILKVYFLANIILPNWLSLIASMPAVYESREDEHKSGLAITVSTIISENTDIDDAISVYGNWDLIYVISNRKHATRYSYQFPVGQVMPEIMEEYMKELQEEQPKLIVLAKGTYNDNIINFLNSNCYHLIWSQDEIDGVLIYVKESHPGH